MTATEREKLIAKHISLLGISREEAEQLVADDEAIDKGAKLFELSAEQEKASKKARAIGTKTTPTKATATKRERKADNDKAMLIDEIKQAIEGLECVEGVEVTNAEREMLFHCNGRKFKIVLSAPRS
ncbi:MAG: hypothetical protein IKV08_00700 [Phascolarctobacterium sp.]|nr:hypothetical protein [Phascolarctobacterium sp.]